MPALKCFHAMVSRQLTEKSWFEVFCTQLVTTLISIMKRVRYLVYVTSFPTSSVGPKCCIISGII